MQASKKFKLLPLVNSKYDIKFEYVCFQCTHVLMMLIFSQFCGEYRDFRNLNYMFKTIQCLTYSVHTVGEELHGLIFVYSIKQFVLSLLQSTKQQASRTFIQLTTHLTLSGQHAFAIPISQELYNFTFSFLKKLNVCGT